MTNESHKFRDQAFAPLPGIPADLKNFHLTFANDGGTVATFGHDNADQLRPWWALQCAKLRNPDRPGFWLMLNVREFTRLKDAATGLPVKRLSSCVFCNGKPPRPLSAAEVREAFTIDAQTRKPLPPQTDIVFVDFSVAQSAPGAGQVAP